MSTLIEWDKFLLVLLNSWHHPLADTLFWYISQKFTWIPFYGFLIFVVIKKFQRNAVWVILSVLLVVAACDQFASGFCKPFFERLRPSHNPELQENIHLVNEYHGGLYGFISSHAANSFGIATLLFLVFRTKKLPYISSLFVWAAVVSYSRIYLGVHYPADIIAGGAVGILFGCIIFRLFSIYRPLTFNSITPLD